MRSMRVYVDTSVFGGRHDEEFRTPSQRFFDRVQHGEFVVLVSDITTRELESAPEEVQKTLRDLPEGSLEQVFVDAEAGALKEAYISAGVVGRASEDDAQHVAVATVAEADMILSWNFRHIVNRDLIRKYNAVNVLKGYRQIDIYSPLEIVYGDEEDI